MSRILASLALIAYSTGVGACASVEPDLLTDIDRQDDGAMPQPAPGQDAAPAPSGDAGGGVLARDGGADAGPRDAGTGVDGGEVRSDAGDLDAGDVDAGNVDAGNVDAGDGGAGSGSDAGPGDAGVAQDAGIDAGVVDACPSDPDKTEPGNCGCGVAEVCQGLIDTLAHRYRFQGSGTTLTDGVGGADGEATSPVSGTGTLVLAGGDHGVLPPGVVSNYGAATIELWWIWRGGAANQRALSFGTVAPGAPAGASCNGTSSQYHDGSWYRFCTNTTATWEQAWDVCAGAGGYLVAIESAAEQQHIADHADWGAESLWIGGNDRQTEGQWYQPSVDGQQGGDLFWMGGVNGNAPAGAYTNWLAGEPANTNAKDCSFVQRSTRQWWAWQCTGSVAHFACEWHGHTGGAMDRGVWFSPSDDAGQPQLGYAAGAGTVTATGPSAFPVDTPTHVALVLDPGGGSIALFIDGAQVDSAATTAALSGLRDGDNWLGRSHLAADPDLAATLTELRIYSTALSAEEIEASHAAGPDPTFLP